MSYPMDWQVYGAHKDGSELTSKEIEAFVALDEDDLLLDDLDWKPVGSFLASFSTESCGAYTRITDAVEKYAKLFPDVILQVVFRDDLEFYPDMVEARDGAYHEAHAAKRFRYDDTDEEVSMVY